MIFSLDSVAISIVILWFSSKLEASGTDDTFNNVSMWGLDFYLSCAEFFLGSPVYLHFFGGAADAMCFQREKLKTTIFLVITAWFLEEATLQFSTRVHTHIFNAYL